MHFERRDEKGNIKQFVCTCVYYVSFFWKSTSIEIFEIDANNFVLL